MEGSFHGKTHGSLSVTTAHRFQDGFLLGILPENVLTGPAGDFDALKKVIESRTVNGRNDIIGLIIEPISGEVASVPPAGYLGKINDYCHENNILTIFDEVKCGMGRSGRFCAFQYEDVVPDVVTMAKALGGSKRAIGVTVSSQALFDKAYGSKKDATLHSCSFGGLGESCAVAIETLNILKDEKLIERAEELGLYFEERLADLQKKHPKSLLEVRGRGLFRAARFNFGESLISKVVDTTKSNLFKTYQSVLISAMVRELYDKHGVIAHFQPGAVDVMHFMPPLVIEKKGIDVLIDGLDDILTRGIADATIQFIKKNIKRVLGADS
jgi:acetylornithine/succinyldiaminopimelate/putrescine aminotransferase